jgi:hypothetical protein
MFLYLRKETSQPILKIANKTLLNLSYDKKTTKTHSNVHLFFVVDQKTKRNAKD